MTANIIIVAVLIFLSVGYVVAMAFTDPDFPQSWKKGYERKDDYEGY